MNRREIICEVLGNAGRMISGSKGRYKHYNPTHLVVFNANLCTGTEKLWYGDIDVTLDQRQLEALSRSLGTKLYVLYEWDGRFENEENLIIANAVFTTDGKVSGISDNLKDYAEQIDGVWYLKKPKAPVEENVPEYNEESEYNEANFRSYTMPLSSFKSSTEDSPLCKFSYWVVKKVTDSETNEKNLSISDIYFQNEDYEELTVQMKNWFKTYHKLKEDSYDFCKNMAWIILDMPCNFYGSRKGPRWAKKGHVYIKEEFFNKKKD